MDDEFVCAICKKKEVDGSKVLTCMYCFSTFHFKCKNIVGSAIRRIKETDYFCSSDCSAIYERIISMRNTNNSLMTSFAAEIKATISASVSEEMKYLSSEVKQITATIEKSQEFLSAKFDEFVTDFKDLKIENEKLKCEVKRLKKSHIQLEGTVNKLEGNVDKSNKAALDNNVVVWGIPTAPDENVSQIIAKLLVSLGLNDNSELVASAERMFINGKTNNDLVPIRIVFQNKTAKEMVLNAKKQFGKLSSIVIDAKFMVNGRAMNVTMRDELTPLSLELLKELRESQELLNIRYIWAGRGGVILVKKDDNSKPEIVKNRDDLNRVLDRYMKAVQMSDLAGNSGNSPSPKRKRNAP